MATDKERHREYMKKWWAEHHDYKIEVGRRWYNAHKDEINAKRRANPKIKAYSKRYADTHKEQIKAKSRRYYKEHQAEERAKSQLWRELNPEKVKQFSQKYHDSHRELIRAKDRINNARYKREAFLLITKGGPIVCATCGCDDIRLLQPNHLNGGGTKDIRSFGGSTKFRRAIIKGKRKVDDLDLRCAMCNTLYYYEMKHPELKGQYKVTWQSGPNVLDKLETMKE